MDLIIIIIYPITGWDRLLHFVRDSISNGSKEVAFAAISCLQTTVMSNCPKVRIFSFD